MQQCTACSKDHLQQSMGDHNHTARNACPSHHSHHCHSLSTLDTPFLQASTSAVANSSAAATRRTGISISSTASAAGSRQQQQHNTGRFSRPFSRSVAAMATTNGNTAPATGGDAPPAAATTAIVDPRLVRLRAAMAAADGGKGVSAYLVPTEDPHMSEYPPETFKRREYISR